MTEAGLYLDLQRMVDWAQDRALRWKTSWTYEAVYITARDHRMHTVCSTLEALGYVHERFQVGERINESAWELTTQGVELYEELRAQHRRSRK